jgi:hypothetical protein
VALTPAEADALVRFRPGQSGGHLEELCVALDLGQGRGLWLRHTLTAPTISGREPVAAVWAVAFGVGEDGGHVVVRETMPAVRARFETEALYLRIGDTELRQGHATGRVAGEAGGPDIAWELRFDCDHEGFQHLPAAWMYGARWPETKTATPQIAARFSGTVRVGDATIAVSAAPGVLRHQWGQRQPERWRWLHCGAFAGAPGVALEVYSAVSRMRSATMPALTAVHLRLVGERITVRPPASLWAARVDCDGLDVAIRARSGDRRLEARFTAPAERFVGVDCADPDGRVAHRLQTKIADGELRVYAREAGVWRETLALRADGTAALEVGTRGDTHGVRIRIR